MDTRPDQTYVDPIFLDMSQDVKINDEKYCDTDETDDTEILIY